MNIELETLIKLIIKENEKLHKRRGQKLVYLCDLISIRDYGSRLSNANFKVYMYGPYSEDISKEFSSLGKELKTKNTLIADGVTRVYFNDGISVKEDKKVEEIVQEAVSLSEKYFADDLEEWSKETSLYSDTKFSELIDFGNLSQEKASEEIEMLLKNKF